MNDTLRNQSQLNDGLIEMQITYISKFKTYVFKIQNTIWQITGIFISA